MLSRRAALLSAAAASSVFVTPAFTTETKPFTQDDFAAAQKAGKPIFVAIHATWCPTCKAQKPILSELMAEPKFKNLVYFVVDFDSQKDAVNFFGAQMQSPTERPVSCSPLNAISVDCMRAPNALTASFWLSKSTTK